MMVNFPSVSKSGLNGLSSHDSPSSGHTFMYSSLVFALLGIIVIVSVILYFRSHQKRRKYSKPGGNEHETCDPRIVEKKEKSFVKLSSFPTSITPVQINRYYSSTSSSSSSVEEPGRDGENFWRCDPTLDRLSTCQVPGGSESGGDRSSRLSFSLRVVPGDEAYGQNISKESEIHLNLIQAYNLRRSYVDPSSKTFSPLTSPSGGSSFEAEGVFARIFPSQKVKNIPTPMCQSRYEKGSDCDSRAVGEGYSDGENVIETAVIKSRRARDISFNEQDSISLQKFQFPVRVTLYEVDRNGVRFSLGHTFITLAHNLDTFQIKTNKLYSTIYRAKNSIKVLK